MDLIPLSALLADEICSSLELSPAFRGKQIFKWISLGAESFDQMTNLPKDLRSLLQEKAVLRSSSVNQVFRDKDGTVKLQIKTHDGLLIETVLLTDIEGRKTACVSCQAGCAMACAFCQTGHLGFARNLTAAEIVEQFLFLEKECGELQNIVFMGMGEPMLNLPAIRKAIEVLTHKDGRALGTKRITLSTCGLVKGIYDLADNGPKIRLALSLTTADEDLRKELMPVSKTNPLPEVRKAIDYYAKKSGRRVTLEAALLAGKNTGPESARRMIDFARGIDVNINLIPWNPVESLPFEEPSRQECEAFVRQLEEAGLNVTLRRRRGAGINGACGQLGSAKFN
ncbi:MAG: 23S rRNA (adenine(2503)-C(2))-methyltransferase RlmN [Treponema sp.]|nr:23S rRNA (adenine(2503)-C(2))-methyltransferase RlmN [Treponema sp.]